MSFVSSRLSAKPRTARHEPQIGTTFASLYGFVASMRSSPLPVGDSGPAQQEQTLGSIRLRISAIVISQIAPS
jgi:hypothetical protein